MRGYNYKYCNPVGRLGPFVHVPIVITAFSFGIILVYVSLFTITDFWNAVCAFSIGFGLVVVMSIIAVSWFTTPICIYLYSDHLIARGLFWQDWKYNYRDINLIETVYKRALWGSASYITYFYGRTAKALTPFQEKIIALIERTPILKGDYRFMNGFHSYFTGMGELTERLLELCPNLEEVIVIKEVLEGYDYGSVWQKEPDMELINRARAKAAENKKKRLEQGGEESERLVE